MKDCEASISILQASLFIQSLKYSTKWWAGLLPSDIYQKVAARTPAGTFPSIYVYENVLLCIWIYIHFHLN